jgi:hypothetical protein
MSVGGARAAARASPEPNGSSPPAGGGGGGSNGAHPAEKGVPWQDELGADEPTPEESSTARLLSDEVFGDVLETGADT